MTIPIVWWDCMETNSGTHNYKCHGNKYHDSSTTMMSLYGNTSNLTTAMATNTMTAASLWWVYMATHPTLQLPWQQIPWQLHHYDEFIWQHIQPYNCHGNKYHDSCITMMSLYGNTSNLTTAMATNTMTAASPWWVYMATHPIPTNAMATNTMTAASLWWVYMATHPTLQMPWQHIPWQQHHHDEFTWQHIQSYKYHGNKYHDSSITMMSLYGNTSNLTNAMATNTMTATSLWWVYMATLPTLQMPWQQIPWQQHHYDEFIWKHKLKWVPTTNAKVSSAPGAAARVALPVKTGKLNL